jgi:tetratricopeptide (TPR) repeat protein
MKNSHAMLVILLALIFALSSCKSVETSRAKEQNEGSNFEKAAEMSKRGIEKNPNDAEAHYQLGISLGFTGDMAGAYRELSLAGKLDPKRLPDVETNIKANWSKHYDSGMAELQSNAARGAAHEFDLATQADPRQIKAWLNLAKVYYSMAESDSTYMLKTYMTVDSLLARNKDKKDPNYGKSLAFEGIILAKRGMNAQARTIFEEYLGIDPGEHKVVEESAVGYLNKKDWESARGLLELVVAAQQKTNSETFDAYYNLGAACMNLKDLPKAIEAFTQAVQLDPESKKGRYYLLLADYQGEQYDDAILVGQEYTTKYPDDANGWRILGFSYGKKGMTMKADEAARKAAELRQ